MHNKNYYLLVPPMFIMSINGVSNIFLIQIFTNIHNLSIPAYTKGRLNISGNLPVFCETHCYLLSATLLGSDLTLQASRSWAVAAET